MARAKITNANLKRSLSWAKVTREIDRMVKNGSDIIGLQEVYGGRLKQLRKYLARKGYGISLEKDVPIAYKLSRYHQRQPEAVAVLGQGHP